jgi:hypothetical protein
MKTPHELLKILTRCIEDAPREPASEKYVRGVLGRVAKNCPVEILVRIGQFVADIRRSELRDEAEQN